MSTEGSLISGLEAYFTDITGIPPLWLFLRFLPSVLNIAMTLMDLYFTNRVFPFPATFYSNSTTIWQ